MIHLPRAQEILTETGDYAPGVDAKAWKGYVGRALAQLEWWAEAARAQRDREGRPAAAPAFSRDPSQRNAPGPSR